MVNESSVDESERVDTSRNEAQRSGPKLERVATIERLIRPEERKGPGKISANLAEVGEGGPAARPSRI